MLILINLRNRESIGWPFKYEMTEIFGKKPVKGKC